MHSVPYILYLNTWKSETSSLCSFYLGRRRAIIMCNYLLESLTTTSAEGGQQGVTKLPVYDTKGLFLASTTQLFNEQCCQTKPKLEELLKTIIKISRIKAKKDGKKCEVFDLINEWCNGGTLMSRSIGTSLMNLYLPMELYDDKVQYLSQPLYDILCKAEKYIGELEEKKASPLSAYLLANILQLFKTLLELAYVSGKSNVESTTKEFIFGNVFRCVSQFIVFTMFAEARDRDLSYFTMFC